MSKRATIALLYDFDKTLCTKDMQEYSFIPRVNMEPSDFWEASNTLAKNEKMDRNLAYMYLMLQKSREAHKPVHRQNLVSLGNDVQFFPGVETWFERIGLLGEDLGVEIEHYIISSGLREIIEGSSISKCFKEIYACDFYYDENDVACWPKNVVNYTTKTQFLFRINKGILDISNDDDLNRYTREDDRAVPFRNMIYFGDGFTDVPCMKLVRVNGGTSIAVYQQGQIQKVADLLKDGRVNFLALADYSQDSYLEKIVRDTICKMAMVESLVDENKRQMKELNLS
jgi:phosphoserine phosphatase